MRICRKCGEPKVATTRGMPVCTDCRVPHRSDGKPRALRTIECPSCGTEHVTVSGNLRCLRCRHEEAKHPCATCGEPCDKRARVCLRCLSAAAPSGDANPNWRGGRSHTARGYVRRRVTSHPRAVNGYVPEHTLVMEERLGRFLLPGESVHHINGQRADNRDENLELWVVSQPAGQRAEDLVAWAREVEARYGHLV